MHYSVVANNLLYLTPRNVGRIAQSIRSLPNTQGSGVRSPSKARSFFFLLVRRWYALRHLFEYLHGLAGIFHAFFPKFARKQNIILITFSSDIPPLPTVIWKSFRRCVNRSSWCSDWLTLHVSHFREKQLWAPGQRPNVYCTWISLLCFANEIEEDKMSTRHHQWHKVPMLSDSNFSI